MDELKEDEGERKKMEVLISQLQLRNFGVQTYYEYDYIVLYF